MPLPRKTDSGTPSTIPAAFLREATTSSGPSIREDTGGSGGIFFELLQRVGTEHAEEVQRLQSQVGFLKKQVLQCKIQLGGDRGGADPLDPPLSLTPVPFDDQPSPRWQGMDAQGGAPSGGITDLFPQGSKSGNNECVIDAGADEAKALVAPVQTRVVVPSKVLPSDAVEGGVDVNAALDMCEQSAALDVVPMLSDIPHAVSRISQMGSSGKDTGEGMSRFQQKASDQIKAMLIKKTDAKEQKLDFIVGWVIIMNTIAMLAQLQWGGYLARIELGIEEDTGKWANAQTWFDVFEHMFNAIFIVEFFIRVFMARHRYFYEAWNVLDFTLVITTSVQLYILRPLMGGMGGKATLFRLLRFGRTVRVLRVVRVMRMFAELRILVQTFISSMRALAWSMVFLFFSMLMGALFLSFSLQDFIMTPGGNHEQRVWMYNHYGSAMRAFFTFFEVTLAGCFPTYFRPLVEVVSGYYVIFIFAYISVVVFAATRIITALLLKQTLQVAAQDAETQIIQQRNEKQKYLGRLKQMFVAIDTSGDGELTLEEVQCMAMNAEAKVVMKMLELEVHDAEALFFLLDTDKTGSVQMDEFIQGVTRLKGTARALDVVAMMRSSDKIHDDVRAVVSRLQEIESRTKEIGRKMNQLLKIGPPSLKETRTVG